MANLTSALRGVALGVALTVASSVPAWAGAAAHVIRLVEHDARAAVFSHDGQLHAIEMGQQLPGSRVRLVAVTDSGVQLEYPASSKSIGGILRLARGDAVPHEWPAPQQSAVAIPQVTLEELPAGAELPLVSPDKHPGSDTLDDSPP